MIHFADAPVMPIAMEEISYQQFCRLFFEFSGFELAAYKRGQTERRVREFAQKKTLRDAGGIVGQSHAQARICLQQFLDYLTTNVTYFFRDPEQFQALRQTVLPALLQRGLALPLERGMCEWLGGVFAENAAA